MADPSGFAVDVEEARKAADESLPGLANHLRGPAGVLLSHEGLHGPGGSPPPVQHLQDVYAGYTDLLGGKLRQACDAIDATADALREIVNLYKRADGRA